MTKSQKIFVLVIGLFILSVAILTFLGRDQASLQTFSATVHRDCAPWDGAAFTVRVPMRDGTLIDISIWQSPDIMFSKTFSFPDDTGQVGNAILIHPVGLPDMLSGNVAFQRVQAGMPIEGRFNFTSERGGQFEGQFLAEWDEQIIMCG
jgi:hypothetical protein